MTKKETQTKHETISVDWVGVQITFAEGAAAVKGIKAQAM